MVMMKRGYRITVFKTKGTKNGRIPEIEKEISIWNTAPLEITIKRIFPKGDQK